MTQSHAHHKPTHHHPLHHHRPLATLALGLSVILSIGFLSAANAPKGEIRTQPTAVSVTATNNSSGDWAVYHDSATGLSLEYPSDWVAKPLAQADERAVILTKPQSQSERISVYISPQGFLGFDGLPEQDVKIAGLAAVRIATSLVGIKHRGNYFTFDAGLNSANLAIFNQVLGTVKFIR